MIFRRRKIKQIANEDRVFWREDLKAYTDIELWDIFNRAGNIHSEVLAPLCAEALRRILKNRLDLD